MQTYAAKKAAEYLSEELHNRVEIGSLYLVPFKSLVLENLYVEDLQKDTLLYAPKFTVDINLFSLKLRRININTVQMDNGQFYLKDFKDNSSNLDFIIDYFDGGESDADSVKNPYEITLDKVVLNNMRFKYRNFKSDEKVTGVNFDNIAVRNLNTTISGLNTKSHMAAFKIERLTLKEKSGFYLKNLSANATIDSNALEFKNLTLQTGKTSISNYVKFNFAKFRDFNHFVKKVRVKAKLVNSRINSDDIAFFIPELKKGMFDVRADGDVSGYVDNIKARNFSIKAGQATYLKGDFNITGLPKLSETFLDLQFDQVFSNKKDAEYIVKSITGKAQKLPDIIQKFGNVNFKGRFSGFPKDFIAYGEFKTALGRIVSDVNMKIENDMPVYTGSVKTFDFNLGELIDEKTLGRVTMATTVKGRSFDLKTLREDIDSKITYFDFKGYRYSNIRVKGLFNRKKFDGQIDIDDRNLALDFKGNVDLNPSLPVFNFDANITKADLKKLKLVKNPIDFQAKFTTNFRGNNLNNIEGNLALERIKLTQLADTSITINGVYLTANGTGNDRTLTVSSDILDASIKGRYDLDKLPDYFMHVAKKYIPSLKTGPLDPGIQHFQFDLTLKKFDAISLLFAPKLKIPDGAVLHGEFESQTNKTTLNGSAKLVQFDKIRVNNLIIDETNTDKALNIFITSDRINFNDSLYVQNINIANFIQNDSLNLNVKLSDKDATNQLDLNGLVEFKNDSTTFSVLPSDVIINREAWKIQDKVRVGYDNNKVTVSNFQLFRDNQLLSINGVISNDPADKIKAEFQKFKLTTFNSLTAGAGINMRGELNGEVGITSALKNPLVDAQLKVDSLVFNNTKVGDLIIDAGFDNGSKLVDANITILKDGKKTLDISGTYNAVATENSLDMLVKMDKSELIIFEPFIKNLVSNLQGTVSSDLKLTGEPNDPKINGTLRLNNAGMTVNYLKTAYHIDDEVVVNNSVIKLDNLVLKDAYNNEATANGTVNMIDPNTPIIEVNLVTKNFMALNTTSKDNPVYYGTAFASGIFRFSGPTNNMDINIEAKTEPGTVFNIPLNAASRVSESEFITFVPKDTTLVPKIQNSFNGLVMTLTLDVDENSEVNIFTDIGKLTGRGKADGLKLFITSDGQFKMTGNYFISKGKFQFSPNDFVDKSFNITNGGSIKWIDEPTEAQINMEAVYPLRANISYLYTAAGISSGNAENSKTVATEVVINLSKTLMHPEIRLGINFPNDAQIKDNLGSYFKNEDNVRTQALNLIVRRNFSAGAGTEKINKQAKETAKSIFTELAFNQLNSLISQSLNLTFVDINIRSLNDASASVKLLNDRLILTGGVTDTRAGLNDLSFIGGSAVARDLELQYLIKRDGSLLAKASNKLNNNNFLASQSAAQGDNSNAYVNALGLVYRQDFDNLNEFLRILSGQHRREERQRELERKLKAQAAPIPKDTANPPTTPPPTTTGP